MTAPKPAEPATVELPAPVQVTAGVPQGPPPDPFVVRAVVCFLGVFALIGLCASSWLVHEALRAADPATALGVVATVATLTTGALTALGAILASTRAR